MENKEIEEGYYWVLLHPIYEEDWTVGYYNGNGWMLHGLDGENEWVNIAEVGDKIPEPPSKINYT